MYIFKDEDVKEFEPLPEGDYECYIENFVYGKSQSGNKYIRVQLRVRTDVEQEGKNRVVSDFIRMEDDDIHYSRKKINRLLGTQEIKDGTTYEKIEDITTMLTGCNLIAHITIDEYNGKKNNSVYFYKRTEHPTQNIISSNVGKQDDKVAPAPTIEDDMPF